MTSIQPVLPWTICIIVQSILSETGNLNYSWKCGPALHASGSTAPMYLQAGRKLKSMWTRDAFKTLCRPAVIGMVHLQALPGAPRWEGDLEGVIAAAALDAARLRNGGVGAIMIENYHDVPFFSDRVPPVTIAAMTSVIAALRAETGDLPLGVNVLRNDAEAALAVAVAVGAAFIRVNVHVGTTVTDQGTITGRAWHTLRQRRDLGAQVGILADVRVKHARPLAARPLEEEAADLRLRGLADAIIVTGAATGSGADVAEVETVRRALPDCPVLVGSGVTMGNLATFAPAADGVIVGTSLKEQGAGPLAPVDQGRTRELVTAWQAAEAHRETT